MKITYLKLENVAGLSLGLGSHKLEIDFSKSINKIIMIAGSNGIGKTVLLSTLTPFSNVTSLDDRSTLSFIISGKDGYKEIRYSHKGHEYIIKHYYKASKESHTVKSYFSLDGEELNENGNVRSFLSLVELHFNLTQEMLRLIRLGTNVNSFISLSPAQRKEYIGKLIEDIDLYMKIHKNKNDDMRVLKVMMTTNGNNLHNCHISNIIDENNKLTDLKISLSKESSLRDNIISDLAAIESLEKRNNIADLRAKKKEAESSSIEFERISSMIENLSLKNVRLEELIQQRSDAVEEKINAKSDMSASLLSIDNCLNNINRLEISINKISSNSDIQSLRRSVDQLHIVLSGTPDNVRNHNTRDVNLLNLQDILGQLKSFNQMFHTIVSLGDTPRKLYFDLRNKNKSVEAFIKDQRDKIMSGLKDSELRKLTDTVFGDGGIITPNCSDEFHTCPYYRLHEVIWKLQDLSDGKIYDEETVRCVKIISDSIDSILNSVDRMNKSDMPDGLKKDLQDDIILGRISDSLQPFDTFNLERFISLINEVKIYEDRMERYSQLKTQLDMYKTSGIESHENEIKEQRSLIETYKNRSVELKSKISDIDNIIVSIDKKISLVSSYNDGIKYQNILSKTVVDIDKILGPLESAVSDKLQLQYSLKNADEKILSLSKEVKNLETKISEYNRLTSERDELVKKYRDIGLILESVSTKKGIPVRYINKYLGRIRSFANKLLSTIYGDGFELLKFRVTADLFLMPYRAHGQRVPDIRYASQSELPLSTIAISFALMDQMSMYYNIPLLDEIDAGLDDKNKSAFLHMLHKYIEELGVDQTIIISHNLNQISNIPIDVIKLSDVPISSKLQNIIYE